MEEQIGALWHRLITRVAIAHHPEAAITLTQIHKQLGIIFRALGGESGIELKAVSGDRHHARRSLLQRIAGSNQQVALAWCDGETLHLPAAIAIFADSTLNRDLYIWLAALAAQSMASPCPNEPWLQRNQRLTIETLQLYPALLPRYQRLAQAHCAQRPQSAPHWSNGERAQELAITQALLTPGSMAQLPSAERPPHPVPLWLHPSPTFSTPQPTADGKDATPSGERSLIQDEELRAAERSPNTPQKAQGLIAIRMENIFSWGEFINLDRSAEEDDDLQSAADSAKDMEKMSISRDAKASAGKIRFDLDLPSEANDDAIQGDGIMLPEWDYRHQRYQADYCRLVPMMAEDALPCELPARLRPLAKRLKAQFQYLAPTRQWLRGQADGSDLDLDAYLRFATDRATGHTAHGDNLFRDLRVGSRDLACLLLADLSLSTDSWVDNHARVIEVIRDALFLFAESLSGTQDQLAIYGFSSRRRDPIRYHQLKGFDEPFNSTVRGRINAITPGYYTRMGAAIRHSTHLLQQQAATQRLLLILTDGKPNDLDHYEGRYGIEDSRQAIREARQAGLTPFCITIDSKASSYLPHIFGSGNYLIIHHPSQLPRELPLLYAQLTT